MLVGAARSRGSGIGKERAAGASNRGGDYAGIDQVGEGVDLWRGRTSIRREFWSRGYSLLTLTNAEAIATAFCRPTLLVELAPIFPPAERNGASA